MPNALAFNLRIQAERRGAGGSKPQIDGIAVLIAGEAEPKVDRMLSPGALDRMFPPFASRPKWFPARPRGLTAGRLRGLTKLQCGPAPYRPANAAPDTGSTCRCHLAP